MDSCLQAQQWLHALLEVLVRSHSHVGRTVEEIRCLKTEHQQFQVNSLYFHFLYVKFIKSLKNSFF